jgi:FtsP/CotA-like multicopper oxidase with cupredoxin domain
MEFASVNGQLSLNLTFGLANVSTPAGPVLLRCWLYDGVPQVPAPTLRLRPGDVLTLRVTNTLPEMRQRCRRAALAAPPQGEGEAECANTFHDVNSLNIHTHGLHVSPVYDNVFIRHAPGTTWQYNIPIRRDHVPGTFWRVSCCAALRFWRS